jgi:hypothetical protein
MAYKYLGNRTQALADLKEAAALGNEAARNLLKSRGRDL